VLLGQHAAPRVALLMAEIMAALALSVVLGLVLLVRPHRLTIILIVLALLLV
jgi:hypothetical protein